MRIRVVYLNFSIKCFLFSQLLELCITSFELILKIELLRVRFFSTDFPTKWVLVRGTAAEVELYRKIETRNAQNLRNVCHLKKKKKMKIYTCRCCKTPF